MKLRYPKYYKEFRCIAAACPDSCCQEWEVDVDPETAARYLALEGSLGDALRAVLRPGDESWMSMTITDRRCPMWRRDGLCRIQAELGHEALCGTCRDFPRLRHDYGDFAELGLELSCPEAARMILETPTPEWAEETFPDGDAPTYDPRHMALLLRSRHQAIQLLTDENLTLSQALGSLLLYGYAIQDALDWDEEMLFSPAQALSEAASLAQPGSIAEILDLYKELEILTPRWRAMLDHPAPGLWTPAHRALARYLTDRYWLQAISDGDLVCRVKFIVVSCLVVKALGGNAVETAQLYSKEIENDPENVDTLLDAAYTSPALTDTRLLGLLAEI